MRFDVGSGATAIFASLILLGLATHGTADEPVPLPKPVLVYLGPEFYETGGKQWTQYRYTVTNLAEYPDELFAASPDLPPCGNNTKSARTWVDIHDKTGKRLYGFCALGSHDDLGKLWFAREVDAIPPSWIYVEMTDRKTRTTVKSELAETTQ